MPSPKIVETRSKGFYLATGRLNENDIMTMAQKVASKSRQQTAKQQPVQPTQGKS